MRCPTCSQRSDLVTTQLEPHLGARVPFTVDRCRNCEGAWFDAGEWAALRAGEFHLRLHEIFTDEWQKQVRDEQRKEREEEQWARQLGASDHRRMRHVKAWIDAHPKRSELYAYLGVHEAVRTPRPAA